MGAGFSEYAILGKSPILLSRINLKTSNSNYKTQKI